MGSGVAGKRTRTASIASPKRADEGLAPGKSTLTQSIPTGYQAIDQGGECVTDSGCMLNPNQRQMLIVQYSARVNAALGSFLAALGDLHVETYVKKENELPWYADLLLGAASGLMVSGIMGVVAHLARGGSEVVEAIAEAGAHGVGAAAAQTSVAGLNAKSVESLIKKAVDLGKKGAGKAVFGAVDDSGQKATSLSYIDFLRNSAMTSFEHLREDPPATASDIELLALFQSFVGHRHTPSMYYVWLKQQLERYKSSHASEIGRRDGHSAARPMVPGGYKLETRVAWLVVGGGKRLIYVDRAFDRGEIEEHGTKPGLAYGGEHALSLADDATWTNPATQERRHADPIGKDRMLGFVEDEFVDVAVQQQEQMWLESPETFAMNYDSNPPTISKVLP